MVDFAGDRNNGIVGVLEAFLTGVNLHMLDGANGDALIDAVLLKPMIPEKSSWQPGISPRRPEPRWL